MIIFSLVMVSGLFFYRILTPSVKEINVPYDGKVKKKMKFRFSGVNSNAWLLNYLYFYNFRPHHTLHHMETSGN